MIIVYLYSRSDLFKFENLHFAWKYHSCPVIMFRVSSTALLPLLCLLWCCSAAAPAKKWNETGSTTVPLPKRQDCRPRRAGMADTQSEGDNESEARRGQEASQRTGLTWVGPVSPVLSAVRPVTAV